MDQIIVSRHGESVASAAGIANGNPYADGGLTAAGEEQARTLGREIAHYPIEVCVTSQFPRTQQTAALALAGRAIRCTVDLHLNDIDYGDFEGHAEERYHAWARDHSVATPIPGGESRLQVASRLCTAFESLLARSERHALVVTHELLIDDLLGAVGGRVPEKLHGPVAYATRHLARASDVRVAIVFLRRWIANEGRSTV